MRVPAQKQSSLPLPQQASLNLARSSAKPLPAGHLVHPIRPPDSNAQGLSGGSRTAASPNFAHDFSRIPMHPEAPVQVQTRLTVNTPGDIYEQEADRVAEQVTSMFEPHLRRTRAGGAGCPFSQNEQAPRRHLATKANESNDSAPILAPPIVHELLNSSPEPMDLQTREFMESRFGHDFSQVRIHADSQADQTSRELNARAFTYGRDIFFRQGEYDSSGARGKTLLAHELTHVLQQDGTYTSPRVQRQSQEGDPNWFLKGARTMTAQPDKTSVVKDPFSGQITLSPEEELSLWDDFVNLLRSGDKWLDSKKGDATQRVGSQIYGPQSSSKDSPGAKPAKKFIDLGSVDFVELQKMFDLLVTTMGDKMPTNSKQAARFVREKFDKWHEVKDDPQKLAEFAHEIREKVEDIKEARERELRKKELSKLSPPSSKTQSSTASLKGGMPSKSYEEFTIPSRDGAQENIGSYWQIYLKARDGSGLFRLTLTVATHTFSISNSYGDELYTFGAVTAQEIFDHYPKGYRYVYVGSPNIKKLLPSH